MDIKKDTNGDGMFDKIKNIKNSVSIGIFFI